MNTFMIEAVKPVVRGQSSSPLCKRDQHRRAFDSDGHAHKDLLLQRYAERIEKLSQQDKLSKFCMDAGFPNVVKSDSIS